MYSFLVIFRAGMPVVFDNTGGGETGGVGIGLDGTVVGVGVGVGGVGSGVGVGVGVGAGISGGLVGVIGRSTGFVVKFKSLLSLLITVT